MKRKMLNFDDNDNLLDNLSRCGFFKRPGAACCSIDRITRNVLGRFS